MTILDSSEERLAAAEARAAAAEKELEGFAYSVSHDLRGPLRTIMSGAMILQEDYGDKLPSDAKDELQRISRSAQKMSGLIDALLRYSRLGRQEMKPGDVDVSALAQSVAQDLMHKHGGVAITVEPGITAHADAPLTKVVLEQILENAVKFGGKQISVSGTPEGFAVKDDGPGFLPEQGERIFLPFEKLNGDEFPGYGMGLALVQRAVARHRGTVRAEGKENGGATVFVNLP